MGAFLRVDGRARSPRVRVALRAATFPRDDGVLGGATRMPTAGNATCACCVRDTIAVRVRQLFHLRRCLIQSCHANGTRRPAGAPATSLPTTAKPGNMVIFVLAVSLPTCFPCVTLSRTG